ncbi:MAG: FeoB-associated Cys-rich membrane protein [Bacteroidales bacterium]
MQDIATYSIIIYALSYTVYHIARIFLPERERTGKSRCSSCAGCSLRKDRS